MKKLCSTFLVVERIYWTFAVNFLSNFSKLQPTGAAERFEALLERSVILWSFLVSERKLPYFGKKFRQVAKVQFTCPQQNFEKNYSSNFHYYHLFWDFQWLFSDFGKNKLVRCVETVIWVYGGKNFKKNCRTIGFWSFLDFEKKNLGFCRKVFGRVAKNTLTCPVEHLQSKFSEWKSWKLEDFRKVFEVFGTRMEKLFQGWQNSNRCPREQFMKTFFPKRKIRSFFPILSQCLLPAKFFARVAKRAIFVSVEVFGEKQFEIYIIFHTFFGLWSKKRLDGKRFFSRVVTTAIRASRDFFLEKVLFF